MIISCVYADYYEHCVSNRHFHHIDQFTGPIPAVWQGGTCAESIEEIDLSWNMFESIPFFLISTSLHILNIANNQVSCHADLHHKFVYYLLFCCFRSPVHCLMSLRTSSRSSTCKTISSKASGVRRLPSSFFFLLVSSPRFLTAGDWEFHVLEALDISNNNVFFSSLVLHTLPFFVPHLLSGEWSGPLLSLCAFVRLSRLFVPRIEQL